MDRKGIEPMTSLVANQALSQLSYRPDRWTIKPARSSTPPPGKLFVGGQRFHGARVDRDLDLVAIRRRSCSGATTRIFGNASMEGEIA